MQERPGRVLITGATGFVGSHLVSELRTAGWRVRAASRRPPQGQPGVEAAVLPDLATPVDWDPLLEGVSHIVHLAGLAHMTATIAPEAYYQVNGHACGDLARAAERRGIRLVHLSSLRAQAGPAASGLITEELSPRPVDDYGRSKLLGEELTAASGADTVILRPAPVHGPGAKGNMARLQRLARLRLPVPFSRFTARQSILSVRNLCSAIAFCIEAPRLDRRLFLVADPEPVQVRQMLIAMREGLGRPPGLFALPVPLVSSAARLAGFASASEFLSQDHVVSPRRLLDAGWRPAESSMEGLKRTMADRAPWPTGTAVIGQSWSGARE